MVVDISVVGQLSMGTDVPHPPHWQLKAFMGRFLHLTRPSTELAEDGADIYSHLNPKVQLVCVEAGLILAWLC